MSFRFEAENPFMSGNASPRSVNRRWMTLAPQPPLEDVFANGMIERDEFPIDRERGLLAGGDDAGFEAFQPVAVVRGKDLMGAHGKSIFREMLSRAELLGGIVNNRQWVIDFASDRERIGNRG